MLPHKANAPQSTSLTNPLKINSSSTSSGNNSHRPVRAEWKKPTNLRTGNQFRSSDNTKAKKQETHHSTNSGNFLFNTYTLSGAGSNSIKNTKLDSQQQKNYSLQSWMNATSSSVSSSSKDSQGFIKKKKNSLPAYHPHSASTSQHRAIQQYQESLNANAASSNKDQTITPKSSNSNSQNSSQLVKGAMIIKSDFSKTAFNDLSNQLGQFNTSRIQGQQRYDLVNALQQFAPPASAKSNKQQTHTENMISLKSSLQSNGTTGAAVAMKQANMKLDFDNIDGRSQITQFFAQEHSSPNSAKKQVLSPIPPEQHLDTSIQSSDFDCQDDVNESLIYRMPSSTKKVKSQDPTPKQTNWKRSPPTEENKGSSFEKIKEEQIMKLTKSGKDSRNNLNSMFQSYQNQTESPKGKLFFGKESNSITTTSEPMIIESTNTNQTKQESQVQMKKGEDKIKNLTIEEIKENKIVNVGVKTPTDVFQYKLKSQINKASLRLENLVSSNQTQSNSHRVTSGKASTNPNSALRSTIGKKKEQSKEGEKIQRGQLEQTTETLRNPVPRPKKDQLVIDNVNFNFTNDSNTQKRFDLVPRNSQQQDHLDVEIPLTQKVIDLENEFRDQKQSIKVIARFRPFNKVESELSETQQRKDDKILDFFDDNKSVRVKEDYYSHSNNLLFTFDHVFQENTTQEELFEIVGKDTIEDIMEGYNGTIFAYGQTGSGKTYTMYGQDMFDEQLMGFVPRAARQIFNYIRSQDLEIEYQIRIQMVEIYKETLRDLLHDSPEQPPDLKIKEDPKRGTYVEGLTDVCIVSEEEIMTVLCTGETMRHVASTNLNQLSSRSHSICIIEITQKYPNDSEKRGVLNLVDLAGSERVSKSHAMGSALEEAKKINFSLSMLGKVINCLTKNAQHIPYRDSKLTRLLKESLGGNNKTSLIVACSMHSSNIEETVSSLRFAQSAKFIQNKVKLNIKTSPEHLQIIIDQLKNELRNCKDEIYRLRINPTPQQSMQQQCSKDEKQDDFIFKPCCTCGFSNQEIIFNIDSQTQSEAKAPIKNKSQRTLSIHGALHNRPHQSLSSKNYDVIETNNQRMQMLSLLSEFSSIPPTGTPNFISPVKNYEIKLMQIIHRTEDLEMKLKSKDKDLEALKQQKDELQGKVQGMEEKVVSYKKQLIVCEKKLAEYESDKDFMFLKSQGNQRILASQSNLVEDQQNQIKVFTQQIKCLQKALEDSDQNCQELLKQKQSILHKNFKDFIDQAIKIKKLPVSQTLADFINKGSLPQSTETLKKSFISQLNIEQRFMKQREGNEMSEDVISLKNKTLLQQNLNSFELVNQLDENQYPQAIIIFILKQLLLDASLANQSLQRLISANRWREIIEFGKFKLQSELCNIQQTTIDTLEQMLEKTRKTHEKLRGRVDKLENHLYDNRNYYGDIVLMTEQIQNNNNNNINSNQILYQSNGKDLINKAFNSNNDRATNVSQQMNQSVTSILQGANPQQNNQKTRFVRTITNKNLGKAFNFVEKSPMSRASLGPNQSILSHYYNQKHNPTNIKQGTPACIFSPGVCNFQSPVRKPTFTYQQQKVSIPQMVKEGQLVISTANEQLTFEDAVAKFVNSSEHVCDEVPMTNTKEQAAYLFSLEDLQRIEALTSAQDIKEYVKQRFEKALLSQSNPSIIMHPQAMFAHYQTNAAYQNQSSNMQSSQVETNQQINSNTTNNNQLYGQSNDDYLEMHGPSSTKNLPCSSSANENQRQDHVLTLSSEYMITSNSVVGPGGLFSGGVGIGGFGGVNQYYQNEYIDRLQEKIVQLQEDIECQKQRAEEHKKAYYDSKRQIEQMKEVMEEREHMHILMFKKETVSWENSISTLREINEAQLTQKHKEIEQLQEILAQWVEVSQDKEIAKPKKGIENLVEKTIRHQRQRSGFLSEAILNMNPPSHRMTSQFENRIRIAQGAQTNLTTLNGLEGLDKVIFQSYSSQLQPMQEGLGTFDRRAIKGDNSPIPQEESYFDIDQTMQMQETIQSEKMDLELYE